MIASHLSIKNPGKGKFKLDWQIISVILLAISGIAGLVIALRQRGKTGRKKREDFCQHLKEIRIQSSPVERNDQKEKIGIGTGQRSEGLVLVENANIDFINVISVSSQYGTNYFLDYLVESPKLEGKEAAKKVKLVKKKNQPLWGQVVDIAWKGTTPLTQRLNSDYRLEDMLMADSFKGSIEIIPEPKWQYTRIRTTYFLPTPDLFKAMDLIAKDIRLEYGYSKGR